LAKWTRKLVDRSSDLNPRNMRLGMYAWLVQRVSGVYLVFFLLTHVMAIAQATLGITVGSTAGILDVFRNPFWAGNSITATFDFVALGIIAFHGLNGIRIVLLDLGFGVRKHRIAFWVTMAIAIAMVSIIIDLALPMLHSW
jgi:succinate dehydrogenase cytochrome b subunit